MSLWGLDWRVDAPGLVSKGKDRPLASDSPGPGSAARGGWREVIGTGGGLWYGWALCFTGGEICRMDERGLRLKELEGGRGVLMDIDRDEVMNSEIFFRHFQDSGL